MTYPGCMVATKRIFGDDRRRLLSKLDTSGGPESCWPFTGARTGWGYGNFYIQGRYRGAHVASYLLFVGPITKGLEVDHLCHERGKCAGGRTCPHRACANPGHLALATHRNNDLRGCGKSADNIRATHCHRGHPFDEENTYCRPGRKLGMVTRDCRKCKAAAQLRYTARHGRGGAALRNGVGLP